MSNMGYDLLSRYVTIMGGVMVIVTVRYTWVSGVGKSRFWALRNYWMTPDCFSNHERRDGNLTRTGQITYVIQSRDQ